MRFVKLSLLCAILVLTLSGFTQAQDVGCDDLVKSSYDTLRISFFEGPPGDTVLMPVILNHDSIVTAFQFLIEFDTTWLSPVWLTDSVCAVADSEGNCTEWNVDSSFIDYVIAGRFLKLDSTYSSFGWEIDTVTKFQANLFQGEPNIVSANFLPEFDDIDSLPPGSDVIFYIKFAVDPAMPEMTLAQFKFYESDIFTVNDEVFPPETTYYNGCHESQMTTVWRVDTDSTVSYQIYPTTNLGFPYYFRANSNYTPAPTVTLTANPSSITESQSTTLSWTSTNADSVVVRYGTERLSGAANGSTSGSIIVSGLTAGDYTYIATAYGGEQQATDDAGVHVTGGGSGDGPVISVTGVQSSYDQGQLISFTVTATNTNSTQITLSTSSLPSNASFGVSGQVTGYSPLSGSFSWTPDFNQEGIFTIRFNAVDNEGSSYKDVSFEVKALEHDRLFSTSAVGSNPVGGLPGKEGIAFPIDLVTSQTVYGVQFDMRYPANVIRLDSFVTTDRIPEYVVYDNIGTTPGEVRVMTFGLDNEPVMDTNTTAILQAILSLDSSSIPWEGYTIYLEDGRESVNPDPQIPSLSLVTDSGVVEVDKYGDVNLDKYIDVADVVNIVAYIIGNFDLIERQFEVADVITNDSVNVFDLVGVVNLIYDIELPSSPAPTPGEDAVVSLDFADLTGGMSEDLTVKSEIPDKVAGVQLELNYDPSAIRLGAPRLSDDAENFALHSKDDGAGRLKIVLVHMAPFKSDELLQVGAADLVEIPVYAQTDIQSGDKSVIRLTEALLSTAEAGAIGVQGVDAPLPTSFTLHQNYPNPFNPVTTIEFDLGVSVSGPQQVNLDIFNVLGQRVRSLIDDRYPTGLHSVEWDATNDNGQRVATGIYLYRLKVGDERQTKKMLFLK